MFHLRLVKTWTQFFNFNQEQESDSDDESDILYEVRMHDKSKSDYQKPKRELPKEKACWSKILGIKCKGYSYSQMLLCWERMLCFF